MITRSQRAGVARPLKVYKVFRRAGGSVLIKEQALQPLKQVLDQEKQKPEADHQDQAEGGLNLDVLREDPEFLKLKEDIYRTTIEAFGIDGFEFRLCDRCGGWYPGNADLARDSISCTCY